MLRNVPVPLSPDPATTLDFWQRLFGRSMLVDFVLKRLKLQYEWSLDHVRVAPPGEGARMACLLFKRLAELEVPVVMVAEYGSLSVDRPALHAWSRKRSSIRYCGAPRPLSASPPSIRSTRSTRRCARSGVIYYRPGEHFNPAGHQMVARLVAERLR